MMIDIENEDNLKNGDDLTNEDKLKYNLKYEDDLKYEENIKYIGNIKIKYDLKYENDFKYENDLNHTKPNQIYQTKHAKPNKLTLLNQSYITNIAKTDKFALGLAHLSPSLFLFFLCTNVLSSWKIETLM